MRDHAMRHEPARHSGRTLRGAAACILVLASLACGGVRRQPETGAAYPEASVILDRHVEATGGRAAYDRVENRVTRATLELVGQGLALEMTIHQAKPNRNYTVIESDLLGRAEKGTDGETAWELSMMTGPQIMKGQQRIDFLREAALDKLAYWRENYETAESAGIESVGDRPCYKVVLTPENGPPLVLFLDRESYLPAKITMDLETPMGIVPMETYPVDFREVDGLLLAHGGLVKMAGQERSVTIHSIEHNVDLPADLFEPPAEIRTLLNETASAEQ